MPGAWQEDLTPEERTLFELIRRDPMAAHGAVAEHVGWYEDPDGHLLLLQHWEDLLAAVTAGALTKDPAAGQQHVR